MKLFSLGFRRTSRLNDEYSSALRPVGSRAASAMSNWYLHEAQFVSRNTTTHARAHTRTHTHTTATATEADGESSASFEPPQHNTRGDDEQSKRLHKAPPNAPVHVSSV